MSLDATDRFENVWQQIVSLNGEEFSTKTGRPFAYDVSSGGVALRNTNRVLPKSHFAEALSRLPVSGPGALNDLQGPSYIWAILNDPRIATSDAATGTAQGD